MPILLAKPLTPRWTDMRWHPIQSQLCDSSARFIAVPAGRRSGKTELAKRRLVLALAEEKPWPDPRYFFGAPSQHQAKRIAWEDLLALVPSAWIAGGRNSPNVSWGDLCIHTVFGSRLHIVGADTPSRIEGQGWDGCVLDESCDLKPGVFTRSVRPALSDRHGWCWRIGVPKRSGPSAGEFREFFERCIKGDYPEGAGFTWPSSGIVPEDDLANARATLDPKDYREQFEATWETVGGQIYHAFDRQANVRPCSYDPSRPLVVGSDFNVDPMAWIIGHRYKDRLEWFDEMWIRNTNTQSTLDKLWDRYSSHQAGFEFYGDAAARNRETSAATSDYQIIFNDARFAATGAGRTIHYPGSNPPLADRYAATNAMLCNAAGLRRCWIDPNCRKLIEDLEGLAYKPGTREPEKSNKDRSHSSDAMSYAIWKLFPLRLDVDYSKEPVMVRRF